MKNKYKKILYVHGLGGSMNGSTVRNIKEVFNTSSVISFDFPNDPIDYQNTVFTKICEEKPDLLVSSSLGAFMLISTISKHKLLIPTVLINPALSPRKDIESNFGYGIREFRKPRLDNIKNYVLDQDYYDKLSSLENQFLIDIKNTKELNVIGVFSTNDEFFSHKDLYKKLINDKIYIVNDTHHVSYETISYIKNILKA